MLMEAIRLSLNEANGGGEAGAQPAVASRAERLTVQLAAQARRRPAHCTRTMPGAAADSCAAASAAS